MIKLIANQRASFLLLMYFCSAAARQLTLNSIQPMIINIENPDKKFNKHLNNPQNDRILFSGKFGTGKSFFLKKYFEARTAEYNVFWISPVHYVVGANQDIFEWIKFEIAHELVTKYLATPAEKKLSNNFLVQCYIYQKPAAIFVKLITYITGQAVELKTGIDPLALFEKDFQEFKSFAGKSLQSDPAKLLDFIEQNLEKTGSIYER